MKHNSNKNKKKVNANNNNNTTKLFKEHARPKTITVVMERGTNGSYHVMGAEYLNEINQYRANWRRLDARNVANELRRAARLGNKLTVN